MYLGLYSDADFAGDRETLKSTSGVFLAILGPRSFYPVTAISQKQTAVSFSSVESEVVAACLAVRMHGLPSLELWEAILSRTPELRLYEDSQATARIIQSGKFPKLRHVQRTHGVSVAWLCVTYRRALYAIDDVHTKRQCADIFTKHFVNKDIWGLVTALIGSVSHAFANKLLK